MVERQTAACGNLLVGESAGSSHSLVHIIPSLTGKKTRGLLGCQYFVVCIHVMDVDKGRDLFVHPKKLFSLFFERGRSFPTRPLRTLPDEWNPEEGFPLEFGLNSDFSHPGWCFGEQAVSVLGCTWNIRLALSIYPADAHFPHSQLSHTGEYVSFFKCYICVQISLRSTA